MSPLDQIDRLLRHVEQATGIRYRVNAALSAERVESQASRTIVQERRVNASIEGHRHSSRSSQLPLHLGTGSTSTPGSSGDPLAVVGLEDIVHIDVGSAAVCAGDMIGSERAA